MQTSICALVATMLNIKKLIAILQAFCLPALWPYSLPQDTLAGPDYSGNTGNHCLNMSLLF